MATLKTKNLLAQLAELETTLSGFSFEELTAEEAKTLKASFSSFKTLLNQQIFGTAASDLYSPVHEAPKNAPVPVELASNKLIAHVSHEIRTPLNGIIGFANLLKEEKLTVGQLKKVDAIQAASHHLMEIINEVLDYTKQSSSIVDSNAYDFNFSGLIKDITFLCKTLMVDTSVALKVNVSPNVPKILVGDPSKISQVLLNLLGNAIKFVAQGQISLSVKAIAQNSDSCILQFTVLDTGIGISDHQLDSIFDSYTQAEEDTQKRYGGYGLGLSIVKEIIEKLGGGIDVKSTLGTGTTFTFSIPFKVGSLDNVATVKTPTVNKLEGKAQLEGTNVLVFEDNELNQHLIREQLTNWHCTTYVTANPEEGLHILNTKQVDVVLMDLKMPEMNGYDLTKKIRSQADTRVSQVPVIAFSADFTAGDQKRCLEAGINDFLLKPYTLNDLMFKLLKRNKAPNLTEESIKLLQQKTIKPAPEHAQVGLDLHNLLEECYGEIAMLEELVRLFKQNIYEFIGGVKIAISNHDFEEIYQAAHKVKAGVALMNAQDLKQIVITIEEQCEQKNLLGITKQFNLFLKKYPNTETQLDSELKLLKSK